MNPLPNPWCRRRRRCEHAHQPSQDFHRFSNRTPTLRLRRRRRRRRHSAAADRRQAAQKPSRGAGRHRRQRAELPRRKTRPPRCRRRPIPAVARSGAGSAGSAGGAARRAEEGQTGAQTEQRARVDRRAGITRPRAASSTGRGCHSAGASGIATDVAGGGGGGGIGGGGWRAQEGADGQGEAEGEGRGEGVVGGLRAEGSVKRLAMKAHRCGGRQNPA
jgi:hypothetical protein